MLGRFGSAAILVLVAATAAVALDSHRVLSVPAIAVSMIGGKATGRLHYVLVQLDQTAHGNGPVLQFNEMNLGGGSQVDADWKEGVGHAVDAAKHALGEDGRTWVVTIKNRSYHSLTGGSSASAAVACAIMAARRGDTLRSGVVLTGTISPDGQIGPVGYLPAKVDGAAQEHMHTILVPHGQALTADWDLHQQGRLRNIKVVEVATLREAYELMTR
jgi:predicted S18 family serine protease